MPIQTIKRFIHTESSAGIVLFFFALIALVWDNSPLAPFYHQLLTLPLSLHLGLITLKKPLLLWINDGMMTLFFLLVGLEVKRELFEGELNSVGKALLPGIAAIGGMVVPAIIYLAINWHQHQYMRGWAIPTATDIAFSLGILSLLGKRIPISLKVLLTAIAIFDDIGAILIIAIFYTSHIATNMLLIALGISIILFILNRLNVCQKWPYLLLGLILWLCVVKSGVHATLVGIVVAFAIPLRKKHSNKGKHTKKGVSPARELENQCHPFVAFIILPVFALANAGVSFTGFTTHMLFSSIPFGIILGLFLGKQIGIFGASWLAIRFKIAPLPTRCRFSHIYGISLLAGVGFTMSLFIGTLAFSEAYLSLVRIGVLVGSALAGIAGYLLLQILTKKPAH